MIHRLIDRSANVTESVAITSLTAHIVSSFVGNNRVDPGEISGMIRSIFIALRATADQANDENARKPAVDIKRAVKSDAVTCLDCGREMQSLKQHLRIEHQLTPEEYRKRWGLSADTPIVAPRYSARRKQIAIDHNLGRKHNG